MHYLKSSYAVLAFVESFDADILVASRSRLLVIEPFRDRDLEMIEDAAGRYAGIRALVVAARDHTALGAVVFQAEDESAYTSLQRLADADLVGEPAALRVSDRSSAGSRAAVKAASPQRAA